MRVYAPQQVQPKTHSAAHRLLNKAVRDGVIRRPKRCSRCRRPGRGPGRRIVGHHEDYSKPLEVVWLCCPCHVRRHNEIREARSKYLPTGAV